MRAVNTNFRSFFSSCVNQITPLHLYSGTRNLGPGPAGTSRPSKNFNRINSVLKSVEPRM